MRHILGADLAISGVMAQLHKANDTYTVVLTIMKYHSWDIDLGQGSALQWIY